VPLHCLHPRPEICESAGCPWRITELCQNLCFFRVFLLSAVLLAIAQGFIPEVITLSGISLCNLEFFAGLLELQLCVRYG